MLSPIDFILRIFFLFILYFFFAPSLPFSHFSRSYYLDSDSHFILCLAKRKTYMCRKFNGISFRLENMAAQMTFYQWWCITFSSSLIICCHFTSPTLTLKMKNGDRLWIGKQFQTIFRILSISFSLSYSLFILPSLWLSFASPWSIFNTSIQFLSFWEVS